MKKPRFLKYLGLQSETIVPDMNTSKSLLRTDLADEPERLFRYRPLYAQPIRLNDLIWTPNKNFTPYPNSISEFLQYHRAKDDISARLDTMEELFHLPAEQYKILQLSAAEAYVALHEILGLTLGNDEEIMDKCPKENVISINYLNNIVETSEEEEEDEEQELNQDLKQDLKQARVLRNLRRFQLCTSHLVSILDGLDTGYLVQQAKYFTMQRSNTALEDAVKILLSEKIKNYMGYKPREEAEKIGFPLGTNEELFQKVTTAFDNSYLRGILCFFENLRFCITMANWARDMHTELGVPFAKPAISGSTIVITKLYNPAMLIGCNPNDVFFGGGVQGYVVKGIMNSGKTYYSESLMLAQYLADAACLIPCQSAKVMRRSYVYIHDVRKSKSSLYVAKCERTRTIFENAIPEDMLIFDDPCSGTDVASEYEGLHAIAAAAIQLGAPFLLITHNEPFIKDVADGRIQNVGLLHFERNHILRGL